MQGPPGGFPPAGDGLCNDLGDSPARDGTGEAGSGVGAAWLPDPAPRAGHIPPQRVQPALAADATFGAGGANRCGGFSAAA